MLTNLFVFLLFFVFLRFMLKTPTPKSTTKSISDMSDAEITEKVLRYGGDLDDVFDVVQSGDSSTSAYYIKNNEF